MSKLFLGFDLSTQQLKSVVFDENGHFIEQVAVNFDLDLSHYMTAHGRIVSESGRVTSPVLMWVEAIDLLFYRLKVKLGGKMDNIMAVGGAAQQHGSVYWKGFESLILSPSQNLLKQLSENRIFTILDSPTWEDSSTTKYCESLHESYTPETIAEITGSTAYERFTGNQIFKIREDHPEEYKETERISLVSSFISSILIGKYAPIETSDGSGMNLLNVQTNKWSSLLCDTELLKKLGPNPVFAGANIGIISPYFVERYGMNKECLVSSITGDNPGGLIFAESIVQSDTSSEGTTLVISLGTSDTVIFALENYPYSSNSKIEKTFEIRSLDGHILSHPTAANKWATLLCYSNGSLAREWICNKIHEGGNITVEFNDENKWQRFGNEIEKNIKLENEFGFYYIMPEIIPKASGIYKFRKVSNEANSDKTIVIANKKFEREFTSSYSAGKSAKLIVESQIMSMKLDCIRKGLSPSKDIARIIVTGGASSNKHISQAIADIFGHKIYQINSGSSGTTSVDMATLSMPALGGVVSAIQCYKDSLCTGKAQPKKSAQLPYGLTLVCTPRPDMVDYYESKMRLFELLRDYVEQISE